MNKHSRFTPNVFSLAVMALAIAGSGGAAAAVISANSSGTVVAPINIAKTVDLAFGSFSPSGALGSVTISPNGSRGVTGGVVQLPGATTAARFNVTGQAGNTYAITLGGSAQLTSGSDTMNFTPVSDVTESAITSGTIATGTLTGGAQSIFVGGVLTVAANQPAGTYSGTVSATVEYN